MFRNSCYAAVILAALCVCCFGCNVGQSCLDARCTCDPCVCPDGCCPANCQPSPFETPADCPGGQCPAWSPLQSVGEAEAAPVPVNQDATDEVKDAPPCINCPQQKPAAAVGATAATPASPLSESKEGVFGCLRCKERTVGRDWHELWADDGTSLTFLCEKCWQATNVSERQTYFDQHIKSVPLTPAQKFYAKAAIAEQR